MIRGITSSVIYMMSTAMTVLLVIATCAFSTPILAATTFTIDVERSSAYLPYVFDTLSTFTTLSDNRVRPSVPVKVLSPQREEVGTNARLLHAQNPDPSSSDSPRFTSRQYPNWGSFVQEYPVKFNIMEWDIFGNHESKDTIVFGVGVTPEGVHACSLSPFPYMDHTLQGLVMRRPDSLALHDWKPTVRLLEHTTTSTDSVTRVFISVDNGRYFRKLFCVDGYTLDVLWQRDVSSPIIDFIIIHDSVQTRLLFTTSNPSNGTADPEFRDIYAYFAILDINGVIKFKTITGTILGDHTRLVRLGSGRLVYIAHALWSTDGEPGQPADSMKHLLSRVDHDGRILESVPFHGKLDQLTQVTYGDKLLPHLWLLTADGAVTIVDSALTMKAMGKSTTLTRYLGELSIASQNKPVRMFGDGIYDYHFNKLLNFDLFVTYFAPLRYDAQGFVSDLLVSNKNLFRVGTISKKSYLALASVFYHNNQIYILSLLSATCAALLLFSYYHNKSRKSLALIARQKIALETAHNDLKIAQSALIEAEKYKQAKDIAGGFAHEIRNALFPADGLLTKLRRESQNTITEGEHLVNYHKNIHAAIKRAVDMTELISEYTKLDSQTVPGSTDIRAVVADVLKAHHQRIEEQQVQVNYDNLKDCAVTVNRKQMVIVIRNLLLNSLDALSKTPTPRITISSQVCEGNVEIRFEDNGEGIASENIPRVFDTFYSTKPTSGVGIGLSMVRKIIGMYGGTITVVSTPNDMTAFTTMLPLSEG